MNPNFNLAMKLCQKSTQIQHHHASFVVVGGKIQSMSFNQNGIHAEVRALKQLWPNKRKGVKVYSMRFTKGGRWGLAKPCPDCEKYMREFGVKVCYYTGIDGKMVKMKF